MWCFLFCLGNLSRLLLPVVRALEGKNAAINKLGRREIQDATEQRITLSLPQNWNEQGEGMNEAVVVKLELNSN